MFRKFYEVFIAKNNHRFDKTATPMCFQGASENGITIIEDDCWTQAYSLSLVFV